MSPPHEKVFFAHYFFVPPSYEGKTSTHDEPRPCEATVVNEHDGIYIYIHKDIYSGGLYYSERKGFNGETSRSRRQTDKG